MSFSKYTVFGHITRQDTGAGIHGLLVEAWDDDWSCDDCLGSALTNRDGSFTIHFRAVDFQEKYEGAPEVYLKVYDRDCRLIHDTSDDKCRCYPDEPSQFDISLVSDILWWHFSRPLSWLNPAEELVSAKVIDEIEEAVELLAMSGQLSNTAGLSAALCSLPPIHLFDNLVQDAWDTLQGDLEAAERYRDVLEALCALQATECCCGNDNCYHKIIKSIFRKEWKGKSRKKKKCVCTEKHHKQKDEKCREPEPSKGAPCPCKESLISVEKATILFTAALHISCGHTKTAKTYLLALLDQICRFEYLGSLHRSAVPALCGDQRAQEHFRDLVEFMGTTCQADQQPRSHFPASNPLCCCEVCLQTELEQCLRDAVSAWRRVDCYTVTEVRPARACAGEEIAICGDGFGHAGGSVVFRQKGTLAYNLTVQPNEWCDDRITVTVPEDAGCGLVPKLPARTVEICDKFLEFHPTGCIKKGFEGTSVEILKYSVKGRVDGECLLPGEVLQIRWKTCAADKVTIQIIEEPGGTVIAELDPADARGSWDFSGTNFTKTTEIQVKITVEGKCSPSVLVKKMTFIFQNPPDLTIQGVEVTQALQYYQAAQHLTDPSDRGPDNSLQLVANKSAWVRVYLRSGQDPGFDNGQLANVGGSLTVERRVGGVWSTVANLAPVNAPVTAEESFPSYDAERSDINASLNFIVPAPTMTGLLRFRIDVSSPDACTGSQASRSLQVDVDLQQQLQIAAIAVGYNGPPLGGGPNVNFPAPTIGQITNDATFALTVYPVQSNPNIRLISTVNATQPLNNAGFPAGGCDPNWTPIINLVANARTADGNQAGWIYYGFVTNNIPISHGNVGCANGGNGAGLLGGGVTFAHEVGHQVGLRHAPCGAVGTVTPAYLGPPPILYEPYDTGVTTVNAAGNTVWQDASIGEYGLNINTGVIFNPNPARPNNGKDLMSYCGNRWISIFTHNFMINNAGFNPVALATGMGAGSGEVAMEAQQFGNQMRPYITIIGNVSADESVQVTSVARVPTRELTMSGQRTSYRVELLDEKGVVISSAPVFTIPAHQGSGGCGCGPSTDDAVEPPFAFIAAMPDVGEGYTLRIREGDDIVWQRQRPSVTPELDPVKVSVRKGQLYVSWSFTVAPETEPEIWLRWSEDGENWHGLAVGLSGDSAEIDPAAIPAERVSIQVIAHDGFNSVSAQSRFVKLPEKQLSLAILRPEDNGQYDEGKPLHLWGSIISGTTEEEPTWLIDDEEVGQGLDTWVPSVEAGEHKVELRAPGAEPVIHQIVIGGYAIED